jgi:hypothetical protein
MQVLRTDFAVDAPGHWRMREARNDEKLKPLLNDRRLSQVGQRRTCVSQIKPT